MHKFQTALISAPSEYAFFYIFLFLKQSNISTVYSSFVKSSAVAPAALS